MIPPLLFVLFSFTGRVESKVLVFVLGLVVFFAGFLLRIWAQMHLHYRLPIKKALTATGPYRLARNPIYIGNVIILLGLCVLSGLLWFLPLMLVYAIIVYSLVIRYEESHLINKYGAPYEAYLAAVPRWMPRPGQSIGQPTPESAPQSTPQSIRESTDVLQYLLPSVKAEMHNFFYLIPFVVKQIFF